MTAARQAADSLARRLAHVADRLDGRRAVALLLDLDERISRDEADVVGRTRPAGDRAPVQTRDSG